MSKKVSKKVSKKGTSKRGTNVQEGDGSKRGTGPRGGAKRGTEPITFVNRLK
jgi:hypothetical protein